LEEIEELLEFFFHLNRSTRMVVSLHLHVSMSHVKKLADFLVLHLPIFLLTKPGTVQGELADGTVLELKIGQCYRLAVATTIHHDCAWSGTESKIVVQDRLRCENLPQLCFANHGMLA
jgi:hypothetical protein